MRSAAAALAAVLLAAAPGWAQRIYQCTLPSGAVVFQDQPCPTLGSQKRFGTSSGTLDEALGRRTLEERARAGEPLANGFVGELRERDRLEALEREERIRRERESTPAKVGDPTEWNPPWGWPGPPGLARPKPTPAK